MNTIQSWGLWIKRWWNRTFYCSFWECKPAGEEGWWRGRSGGIILLEPLPCEKCGTLMGVPDNGEA